ncbi:MAG: FMN-binding negative transcriptional regulator [Nevskia sp.]|nr:FMN-binding negative transcriptional regulator [Nevskia sp.]
MYVPTHFAESGTEALHALIRAQPLATLVTMTADGLEANHIPMHLESAASRLGTLRGHVARANPVWRTFDPGVETLVVFTGVDAYVSPSWYATKAVDGRVVPTWNYEAVHVYGRLRIVNDAGWLRDQLDALTGQHESGFDAPWQIDDAPAEFIARLMQAIVGFEVEISRMVGKLKLSQNRSAADRAGVIAGLEAQFQGPGCPMAALIRQASA